jgi:hypothetical protein
MPRYNVFLALDASTAGPVVADSPEQAALTAPGVIDISGHALDIGDVIVTTVTDESGREVFKEDLAAQWRFRWSDVERGVRAAIAMVQEGREPSEIPDAVRALIDPDHHSADG